ncbi:MAG: hypothetical protein PHV30_08090 [Candidatus Margulisbacteria bacterium]|nr:hypothetical protein [Candidatus Margulisiibacteriota bacterium]
MDQLLAKLKIAESMQIKEYKVYEKFFMQLEKYNRELLPNINQPEKLNEMMIEKRSMMQDIQEIEAELSPLRKEIAALYTAGKLNNIDQQLVEKIKNTDMTIIDMISKISKSEQELTHKIKEQMELIKNRLQHIGQERGLKEKYTTKKRLPFFNKMNGDLPVSKFDTSG